MEVSKGPWDWNASQESQPNTGHIHHHPVHAGIIGGSPQYNPHQVPVVGPPPMNYTADPIIGNHTNGSGTGGGYQIPWWSGGVATNGIGTENGSSSNGNQPQHTDIGGSIENEPPLLEELGIYPHEIKKRLKGVLLLHEVHEEYLRQCDMTGPICVLAVLALSLVLTGRMHISYIYSLGIGGSIGMYLLLNLMSQTSFIDLYTTISILGYSLLPVTLCGFVRIFYSLRNSWWGITICLILTLWSTATSSRFFETVLHLQSQRFLVAYPLFLFYSAFVLLVIL